MSDANFDADLDREARKDNFEKLCGKNGEWDDIDEYCLVAQKSFGDVVKPEDWYLRKDKL